MDSTAARVDEVEVMQEELQELDNIQTQKIVKYPHLPEVNNDHDWQYVMRRSMQQILPNVFLGPYAAASKAKLEEMLSAGLTHVICVRMDVERNIIKPNHPNHFKYLIVEIADSVLANIIPHIRASNDFIDQCLKEGGKVLIHGNGGISRSPALVIAYVMTSYGVTLKEAFSYVQNLRFCINPNEGFMNQLREFEVIYKAMHTTVPRRLLPSTSSSSSSSACPATSSSNGKHLNKNNKRPLEEDEVGVQGDHGFGGGGGETNIRNNRTFSNIANCDNDDEIEID